MIVNDKSKMMQVPECIRVAGGESHITTSREPPLEMKLEDRLFGKSNDLELIQLNTPPRTLRYEDAAPIFAEPIKQLDKALNISTTNEMIPNNLNNNDDDNSYMLNKFNKNNFNDSTMIEYNDNEMQSASSTATMNFFQLRRRVLQLSHRIDALEIENRNRNKRDYILLAIGTLYILFRWFVSSGSTSGVSRRGF